MAALTQLLFYLIVSIYTCDAYKALVATQMPSRSHSILNGGIVRQLLKDGNEVTYIRSVEYENPPPTLRQIDVSSNAEALPASAINIKVLMDRKEQGNDHKFALQIMTTLAIKTLEHENVRKLLSDPKEHFDVVIVEFMDTDMLASLAAVFDCPLIWLSPIDVTSNILSRIDATPNPSYVVDAFSSNVTPFTFQQRLDELWYRIKTYFLQLWYFDDMQTEAYNRLITPLIKKRGRVPPTFDEVKKNVSLVLGYSHVSMGEAYSLPQNYKPVGGYHIDENIKPLPKDLKKLMDNAKDGVIFFSMGSNLKSSEWPTEIKQNLLKMFGGLKQTVLWKFEEHLLNTPKNVHISKWYPQLSILSHPNCVALITHGGLLSTAEALHVGVPIIGIPGFGDQFVNINRAEQRGFGLKVDMSYNVVEDLAVALEKITSNPSYRQKAKELSFVYHDRPVKPIEELSFWVRHVVQTHGAPHLKSPALQVPIYQQLYLDLAGILLVILIIIFKLLRFTCCLICPKSKIDKKVDSKKKKK